MWRTVGIYKEILLKVVSSEYSDVKSGDYIKIVIDEYGEFSFYSLNFKKQLKEQKNWDIEDIDMHNYLEKINQEFRRLKVVDVNNYSVELL